MRPREQDSHGSRRPLRGVSQGHKYEGIMMSRFRYLGVWITLGIAAGSAGADRALAQLPYGAPLHYPSAVNYGFEVGAYSSYPAIYGMGINQGFASGAESSTNSWGNLGYVTFGATPYNHAYGSYGTNPFSVSGYGVTNGAVRNNFQSLGFTPRSSLSVSAAPQTRLALQPVFDVITAAPGWYRSQRRAASLLGPNLACPASNCSATTGQSTGRAPVLTTQPSPLRHAAEGAVKEVVRQGKSSGHASVRQVVDAKAKLTSFAREALPKLKTRNAADASGLESFVVELEKTLQTMADRY